MSVSVLRYPLHFKLGPPQNGTSNDITVYPYVDAVTALPLSETVLGLVDDIIEVSTSGTRLIILRSPSSRILGAMYKEQCSVLNLAQVSHNTDNAQVVLEHQFWTDVTAPGVIGRVYLFAEVDVPMLRVDFEAAAPGLLGGADEPPEWHAEVPAVDAVAPNLAKGALMMFTVSMTRIDKAKPTVGGGYTYDQVFRIDATAGGRWMRCVETI